MVLPVAQVLQNLGTKNAWVVHGSDGLDEITTTGETYIAKLENGKITETTLTPSDFGLEQSNPDDLIGGTPEVNAQALLDIMGGAKNAYRDIVVANTAAVLIISGKESNLEHAVEAAKQAIDSGRTLELLNQYKAFTQEHGAAA